MAFRITVGTSGALAAHFIINRNHDVRVWETPMLLLLMLELVASLTVACRRRFYCIVYVMVDF